LHSFAAIASHFDTLLRFCFTLIGTTQNNGARRRRFVSSMTI
jgi:hypothetical protein